MADALFIIPLVFYVVAFLYETYLSLVRLGASKQKNNSNYVSATWEITHTLLVFSLVMLLMLHTNEINELASMLFVPAFLAGFALTMRAFFYVYVFYVREPAKRVGIGDWLFAASHVLAVIGLVATAFQALKFISVDGRMVNDQFLPIFVPGLVLIMALCAGPIFVVYKNKD